MTWDWREARSRAAGAVRSRGQVVRVEVQQVVVRDQLQPDRQVVLVDLVDAVHQRDLRGRDVRRAAEVGRVARIRDQGEPVCAELLADARSRAAPGERPVRGARLVLDERSVGALRLARVIARVEARVALHEVRVDVPVASGRAHRGMEPEGRQVRVQRGARIGDPAAAVGVDARVTRGEAGRHDRRLLEREALELPVRSGEVENEGARPCERRVLTRRSSEHRGESAGVQPQRADAQRVDRDLLALCYGGLRSRRPERLRAVRIPHGNRRSGRASNRNRGRR